MKYRSRTEIVAQILEAPVGGTPRVKIMYKAFLGHQQLKEYLALLVEDGLLDYDQRTSEYKTTERGARILSAYEQLEEMIQRKPQE